MEQSSIAKVLFVSSSVASTPTDGMRFSARSRARAEEQRNYHCLVKLENYLLRTDLSNSFGANDLNQLSIDQPAKKSLLTTTKTSCARLDHAP